jgi:hypothetical protein
VELNLLKIDTTDIATHDKMMENLFAKLLNTGQEYKTKEKLQSQYKRSLEPTLPTSLDASELLESIQELE